jgi:hypothetical protein
MKLFVLALHFGSPCRFERNYPATAVSVLVQYMRGWGERRVRMGDSGCDVGGWVMLLSGLPAIDRLRWTPLRRRLGLYR